VVASKALYAAGEDPVKDAIATLYIRRKGENGLLSV
jgi:hypothetical protein